ncbi:MAG TPA: thioredoxin-disulfide reductase [Candidatus Omnitrophota bacterium]|nr:thioredoxin-disulfide reductase [Candidatus Omnitrophota bacterium]HRY85260.1 thioredoxin-disulfide reductase [Candidatus Omnitrophota bacterium]
MSELSGKKTYDVMIIGGGGAGLTAALYTSRAKLSTVLFEKLVPGGQIASTDLVENYPGFPEGVLGPEVAQKMEAQAARYGAEIIYEEVLELSKREGRFEIKSSAGTSYAGRAVILAMGASFRTLGVPLEKQLTGKGVSYCATCDGAFFKGKKIIAVGGGDSALQEGLFLTRFAEQVTIVHRRDALRASPILQERAKKNPKISFIWDAVVDKIEGEKSVTHVLLKNVKTGAVQKVPVDGVFIFIGHDPNSGLARGFVKLNEKGYVVTDANLAASVPGVFAAGEVREGAVRQLVSACGEGCAAALAAQAYLEGHH